MPELLIPSISDEDHQILSNLHLSILCIATQDFSSLELLAAMIGGNKLKSSMSLLNSFLSVEFRRVYGGLDALNFYRRRLEHMTAVLDDPALLERHPDFSKFRDSEAFQSAITELRTKITALESSTPE